MANPLSVSSQVFDELFTTIDKIGIERTIKKLQEAKSDSMLLNDLNIEFIINSVSTITSVSRDRILTGSDRNDERKIATALCVYFIITEFNYSYKDIKNIFNKDTSVLNRYCLIVKNRTDKPRTDYDKTLQSHFSKINLLVTEKKLNDGKR